MEIPKDIVILSQKNGSFSGVAPRSQRILELFPLSLELMTPYSQTGKSDLDAHPCTEMSNLQHKM